MKKNKQFLIKHNLKTPQSILSRLVLFFSE